MIRKIREFRRSRRSRPSGPVAVIAKSTLFGFLSYATFFLWFPVLVVRTLFNAVSRVFRQAQVEGAAARRQARRAQRLAADASDYEQGQAE